MSRKDLVALKQEKLEIMTNIMEEKRDSMSSDSLALIKSTKQEVLEIANKIEAIDETRSTQPKGNKVENKQNTEVEQREAFGEYLRGDISEKQLEKRMTLAGTAGKAKELVPDAFLTELFETIKAFGKVSGKAKHITTAQNGELSIPVVDDTKNQGAWTDEAGAISVADIETKSVVLNSYKVATGITVSTEMLEDSFFDLSGYIARALGERLARTLEASYINGDAAKKPQGIVTDVDTVKQTSTAAAVTIDELVAMQTGIVPGKREGAEYLVSDALMTELKNLKDKNDRPLLQAEASSTVANDIIYRIGGYPVSVNYELDNAAGKTTAIFGNLSNYLIRDVRNLSVKRDDYSGMKNDLVSFYATMRVDAKPVSGNAAFVSMTVKA